MNEHLYMLMHNDDDKEAVLYLKGVSPIAKENIDRFYDGLSVKEIAMLRRWLNEIRKDHCNCEQCQQIMNC